MMRTIVGGVGYRNLRDHSVGVAVSDRLEHRSWPAEVVVEDLSYNPIAVVQRLDDEPAGQRFARAVLVAGVERPGRAPGTVTAYRWDGTLPPADEIQRAVTEAVTGVIALDNTLVVARHFGALPDEVAVVEVQPAAHEFGEAFSASVAAVFEAVCDLTAQLAIDHAVVAALPRAPLGGRPQASPGGAPRTSADAPLACADTPLACADTPLACADAPLACADAPLASADAPLASADTPLASADAPLACADAPLSADTPQCADTPPAYLGRRSGAGARE